MNALPDPLAVSLPALKIATQLEITDATVKVHVKHLLKKLGQHTRGEAALWCLDQRRRGSS